ncbi:MULTISPECIES: VacJ family lipoprotein [unclassified Variovorax]|uniref:MlaA family lipoprotein n=1 Tax=unclassified Variovorax TaxID=663243 RepID=UPI002576DFD0|nr:MULTISPECIES: VacJ family lipoprotein [unclassified Variovorax]MDM0088404.1 VacJ family lipoprotein [Variovorax sp. J22G40]MDM0146477.1 VacJ family lipoprotein [Variovorax sp. J2P1-31]
MKTRSFLSPASHAVKRIADHARWVGAAVVLAVLAGCATGPNANPSDPFEPFNRGVFSFNEKVDEVVLVPVSTAYVNVLPSMVRTGVNNFFGNLGDIWSFANSVAQLKLQNSAETFMRVNVNTIFGLGGLIDVATEVGIDRHDEDFGKTLGRWGVGAGPYVVLPLLGPSTLRDTAAKPVDLYGDALNAVQDVAWRNSLTALRVVDKRSQYLRAGRLIDDAALDKYSFTRDAFLQRRRSQIQDGRAPDDDAGK